MHAEFPLSNCFIFLGLNLLDIIEDLRNEDDDDLIIQCNVFDDEKQEDDEDLAALKPSGIDITNTQEVFNALYEKVKVTSCISQLHSKCSTLCTKR